LAAFDLQREMEHTCWRVAYASSRDGAVGCVAALLGVMHSWG
jgi:hypothetical protein